MSKESLEQYIKNLEAIPLSCDQLVEMSDKLYYKGKQPRIKCLLYDSIPPHSNIDQLMADLDAIIILYQIGHFISLPDNSLDHSGFL